MSRYVKVNDVKESLLGWDEDPKDEDIEYAIDKLPATDIVRCKECKGSKWCRYNGEFYLWCNLNIKRVKESDFCSDGERKENE